MTDWMGRAGEELGKQVCSPQGGTHSITEPDPSPNLLLAHSRFLKLFKFAKHHKIWEMSMSTNICTLNYFQLQHRQASLDTVHKFQLNCDYKCPKTLCQCFHPKIITEISAAVMTGNPLITHSLICQAGLRTSVSQLSHELQTMSWCCLPISQGKIHDICKNGSLKRNMTKIQI